LNLSDLSFLERFILPQFFKIIFYYFFINIF